jgi:hypothetical protein
MFHCPPRSRVVAILLAAWVPTAPCWAAKTDQVVLANGDRITGEIKSLEQGRLSFSTDDLGTVSIEWDKVAQVVSRRTYEVERSDGTRHFGDLRATPAAQPPVLLVGEGNDGQAMLKISRCSPLQMRVRSLSARPATA